MPKRGPNNASIKLENQAKFIAAYVEGGMDRYYAIEKAGIDECTFYRWQKDQDFRNQLADAFKCIKHKLIEAAVKRALIKSDTLLIFLLKAADPEMFDEDVRRQRIANEGMKELGYQIPTIVYRETQAPPHTNGVAH